MNISYDKTKRRWQSNINYLFLLLLAAWLLKKSSYILIHMREK